MKYRIYIKNYLVQDKHLYLKGQFNPKCKMRIFPLDCSAFYPSRFFWCEFQSFGDNSHRDVSPHLDIMELDATRLKKKKERKKKVIIHRACCVQFHVGTTLFLQ